ncbi:hypothetical protein ACFSTC_28685 [Nonomuraea ferruginea]
MVRLATGLRRSASLLKWTWPVVASTRWAAVARTAGAASACAASTGGGDRRGGVGGGAAGGQRRGGDGEADQRSAEPVGDVHLGACS